MPSNAEFRTWNEAVIAEFRANRGVVSQPEFPILLLTTTGARTGRRTTTPVAYGVDNGRVFVVASKAGAPTNPAWYHNLIAHPEIVAEIGDRTVTGRAVEAEGEERARLYALISEKVPPFKEYERTTERVFPVVVLEGVPAPGTRKLSVSTLVSLDGVIQDPGGFGEQEYGGWANPYFGDEMEAESLQHLDASDYFLIGRRTYELLNRAWGGIKHGAYLQRMNEIPKLVASTTLSGPLEWNATVIDGDVPTAVADLLRRPGGDIEVYGSPTLVQTLMRHDLIDEYRIALHPVILGHGTLLFPQQGVSATLHLADARTADSGVVHLTYTRTTGDAPAPS